MAKNTNPAPPIELLSHTHKITNQTSLILSPSTSCFFSLSHEFLLLLSSLTAPPPATLTTGATFSFFSSLLNTEPVEHSPCFSRSFSFAEQIKLKLLFSLSQVSSSTRGATCSSVCPTTATPLSLSLSPFIHPQFWLAYLLSAAAIISYSQCFQVHHGATAIQ